MQHRDVAVITIALALVTTNWSNPSTVVGSDASSQSSASDGGGNTDDLMVPDDQALYQFEERAQAAGAIGFYRDEATSSLVVLVPAGKNDSFSLAELGPRPLAVRVEYSDLDAAAISAATEKLVSLQKEPIAAQNSMAFFFEPAIQKIAVFTTVEAGALSSFLGESWKLIDYHAAGIEVVSRGNDQAPFWGGAKTHWTADPFPDNYCTTGFTVIDSGGSRHMVQPAHCGPVSGTVKNWSLNSILGTYGNKHCGNVGVNDNSDVQWISGGGYGNSIYIGNSTGSRADVAEAGIPGVGAAYKYSGGTTAERSGQVVISTDAKIWWDDDFDWCDPDSPGGWWQLHLISFNRSGVCDVMEGDSGAPFYIVKSTSGTYPTIGIRGMVTARTVDRTVCFAEKWTRIQSLLGGVSIAHI